MSQSALSITKNKVPDWPQNIEPHFYLETCTKCKDHAHLYHNHSEDNYIMYANQLKELLALAIPAQCGGPADCLLINQFHSGLSTKASIYYNYTHDGQDGLEHKMRVYFPTHCYQEIASRASRRGKI